MARVIDLQEQTEITEDAYILTDNATTGTHKFNLKQLYDDSQDAIADATNAAASATSAATSATSAATDANEAAVRVEAAIDAVEDISELAVPEMSPDVRGGAKLDADGGLALRDGALGVGSLVQESSGQVRGGLAQVTAKGHAEQDGTPTPDSPQEIRVVRGRNLAQLAEGSVTLHGVTFTSSGGVVSGNGTYSSTSTSRAFTISGSSLASSSGLYYNSLVSDSENTFELPAGTYTFSADVKNNEYKTQLKLIKVDAIGDAATNANTLALIEQGTSAVTFTVSSTTIVLMSAQFETLDKKVNGSISNIQLELGSTPTPYVPYGHVGMAITQNIFDEGAIEWIRGKYINSVGGISDNANLMYSDMFVPIVAGQHELIVTKNSSVSNGVSIAFYNELKAFVSQATVISSTGATGVLQASFTSPATGYLRINVQTTTTDIRVMETATTPIPLPQRGWVGSLPDGTADVLRLDGAGKVEWELADAETTTAATDGITGTVGVDVLSTTGQIADGATVLYPLATPVTEQCAYVDMPSIPGDATVTIRELDDLGIKYFIDDAVLEYGRQIYERVRSEYADRIEQLEQSVAELATA